MHLSHFLYPFIQVSWFGVLALVIHASVTESLQISGVLLMSPHMYKHAHTQTFARTVAEQLGCKLQLHLIWNFTGKNFTFPNNYPLFYFSIYMPPSLESIHFKERLWA